MDDAVSSLCASQPTELLDGKVQPVGELFLLDMEWAAETDPAGNAYSQNVCESAEQAGSGSTGGSTKVSAMRVGGCTSNTPHGSRKVAASGRAMNTPPSTIMSKHVECTPCLARAMIAHVSP